MEQKFKHILNQLAVAILILSLVTALSFGIRKVRFSLHQAESSQSTLSARPSDTDDLYHFDKSLNADTELDYYQDDSYTVDDEQDLQYADALDFDEQASSDEISEEYTDSAKEDNFLSEIKSFKGDYAKSGWKGGLQTISLSDTENIYITEKGEAWFVSEQSDGKVTKMQVQLDGHTGDLTLVGGSYSKSDDSQEPQRISMSESEDIYLTDEGEAWYVSEQPDGSTAKVQLEQD